MAPGLELLDNGTKVFTGPGAAFGTDALLLARFAMPRRKETALDLCSMVPPVRPVPCTMAASWPYATARNRWRRCLPRSAPLGWSPSGWLWCARMNTANPGCFWWKPRKEESRGSGGRRTF